ncbi:MAG: HAD family phosphatase [Rhizobacter sp.]|nr:HAD family phosphatase [Rhizobacter sp.]
MNLALFDLDHTLIPFDSGMAWTQYLVRRGVLPAQAEARYLEHCRLHVAGTLDIHAMHRACVLPLAACPRSEVSAWLQDFGVEVAPRLPAAARVLVDAHLRRGDLCAIVTATTRFIAEPFARLFNVVHLLATEPATLGGRADSAWTGDIQGEPCFRAHKLGHVSRWLEQMGQHLDGFESSTFYSDSASDLPLLRAVTHAVAVRPDQRLRAVAESAGWRVIEDLA